MEWRWKDLKSLKATLSQYESSLRVAQIPPGETLTSKDDPSDSMAEGAMTATPVADDAPP